MAEERFEVEQRDGADDRLTAYRHGDRVTIEIEEPWAGDSHTGFGRTCSIGLTVAQASELAQWLQRAALFE